MSNSATPCVRNCDTCTAEIRAVYDSKTWSWRKIAQGDAGAKYKGMPPGTLCAIYHGAPIPKKWHEQLGVPPKVTITPINNHPIPEGTQVYMARPCINDKCGHKSFSPNTSKRYQCYTCQKVRVRKP